MAALYPTRAAFSYTTAGDTIARQLIVRASGLIAKDVDVLLTNQEGHGMQVSCETRSRGLHPAIRYTLRSIRSYHA
jgi:hypothetical protein